MPWNRRSIRLKDYDYTQNGAYYVTACAGVCGCRRIVENARNRDVFGYVVDGRMVLNQYGAIVEKCWHEIPDHFPQIELDGYIIMPNHMHGIIMIGQCNDLICNGHTGISRRGTACRAPTENLEHFGKPVSGSLSTIMRSFKSAASKQINQLHDHPQEPIWQRNFYEHVIHDESDLDRIREYIMNNPLDWAKDEYYEK